MRYIFSFLFLGLLFLPGGEVHAQLLTCTEGDQCNFCELTRTLDNIIDWVVMVAILIATIGLAYAGFRMSSSRGDVSTFTAAKEMLWNIVIGLFIIMAAWMIVDTIIKTLAGGDLGVWNELDNCGGMYRVGETNGLIPLTKAQISVVAGVDEAAVSSYSSEILSTGGGNNCPGASASQVVGIEGEPGKYLLPAQARNFVAMRAAAASDGISLRLSSAWRSQATQEEIWARHNCDVTGCAGTVARPCSKGGNGSNHNGGVAVDIVGSERGTAIYNWLSSNGGRYNFYNNLGPNDPVHWSPTGK